MGVPTQQRGNFVPVSALDHRPPSKLQLLRGMVRQAPFVAKNFQLYFWNAWRQRVLQTKVVAPYAVTFYVTHKCNLACTYCTQKAPDVFSDELGTAQTRFRACTRMGTCFILANRYARSRGISCAMER